MAERLVHVIDDEDAVRRRAPRHDADALAHGLTARERDVLYGLALGYPNKTIAHNLGISPRTVEVHRADLTARFGARSLSDVLSIAFAARAGQQSWPPQVQRAARAAA